VGHKIQEPILWISKEYKFLEIPLVVLVKIVILLHGSQTANILRFLPITKIINIVIILSIILILILLLF